MRLIFGCGYLGERVAMRWRHAGDDLIVVTRGGPRTKQLELQGYRVIVADVTRPNSLRCLAAQPAPDAVLYAVGYDHTAGQSIQEIYEEGVRNVLAAIPPTTGHFIYISSTGVYGDASGEWIDERTPTNPRRAGGQAALAAEQAIRAHQIRKRAVILRLAGLYGPGRIPFLDALRAGEPIPAAGEGYLNLIHVDDAARAVLAADRLAPLDDGPRILCVSDGQPVRREDYYREVARQIGAPPPRFVAPPADSPRASRAQADRRVSNSQMLAQLKVTLMYPDYRAGLAAIIAGTDT
jgi:nucleoside-diphosphate-sugar epimerase